MKLGHHPLLASTGKPELGLSNQAAFGNIALGQSVSQTLTVTHTGDATLTVSNIQSSSPQVVVSPRTFDLVAGEKREVTIILTPGAKGDIAATLTVISNALDNPVVQAPVVMADETPGDFDGDGRVAFPDFLAFPQAYGSADSQYDLDGDGQVAFSDFLIFASLFGRAQN